MVGNKKSEITVHHPKLLQASNESVSLIFWGFLLAVWSGSQLIHCGRNISLFFSEIMKHTACLYHVLYTCCHFIRSGTSTYPSAPSNACFATLCTWLIWVLNSSCSVVIQLMLVYGLRWHELRWTLCITKSNVATVSSTEHHDGMLSSTGINHPPTLGSSCSEPRTCLCHPQLLVIR